MWCVEYSRYSLHVAVLNRKNAQEFSANFADIRDLRYIGINE